MTGSNLKRGRHKGSCFDNGNLGLLTNLMAWYQPTSCPCESDLYSVTLAHIIFDHNSKIFHCWHSQSISGISKHWLVKWILASIKHILFTARLSGSVVRIWISESRMAWTVASFRTMVALHVQQQESGSTTCHMSHHFTLCHKPTGFVPSKLIYRPKLILQMSL